MPCNNVASTGNLFNIDLFGLSKFSVTLTIYNRMIKINYAVSNGMLFNIILFGLFNDDVSSCYYLVSKIGMVGE
jgi:hypothetical protein